GEIREFLRAKLPDYMIPAEFVVMDALPLTPNGKIDRRNLPRPRGSASESAKGYVAPSSAVEEVLAAIWEQDLDRDRVGIADDFFALGGHSLTAMRVISAIRYIFKVDLTVSKMFESPTVQGLARELRAVETKPGQMEGIARIVQRIKRMSPEQKAERLRSKAHQSI
ncbi:MAG TPA: phosphopantetheine-binding protein, partial [Blastocatellia bacterium]|nr:phosphopantetheine-binding protein [Blastocatellia bacterium]